MTYMEVLFYAERVEFDRLKVRPNPMQIDGENHPYSNRLYDIVAGMVAGLEQYVRPPGQMSKR